MPCPVKFRPRGGRRGSPPPSPALPSAGSSDQPSTVIGLFWGLSKSLQAALIFVFTIGSLSVILTGCFVGACLAVAMAGKGLHGIPLRWYVLSVEIGGSSILTLAATLVSAWIRRLVRASRADAESDRRHGSSK